MALTETEGEALVKLARSAVEDWVLGRGVSVPAASPYMEEKRGAFVTITLASSGPDNLRGCVGFPLPVLKLGEAVCEAAVAAASQDPRFPPLRAEELGTVIMEVSVLTPPSVIVSDPRSDMPSRVRIGLDGLVVSDGQTSGLLFPQVATEHGMNQSEFLAQACMKAGLPPDAWLDPRTTVESFEAEVFVETEPRGGAVRVSR
ncbi:MAG: TIGR00296 family protein [Thaumarchaeota archaeon]|nr:TIGR00296 family protein [Nitrososphaerota archaeon]